MSGRTGSLPAKGDVSGVLVPEIFSPQVARSLPRLFAATAGPRVALFHDAIALQFPEFTPRSNVARFPSYLRELLQFDGVAAVSEASRESLLGYWRWLGASRHPGRCRPAPWHRPAAARCRVTGPREATRSSFASGALRGEKTMPRSWRPARRSGRAGLSFELRLVGITNAETGGAALRGSSGCAPRACLFAMTARSATQALEAAYRECSFTVYPSLAEGFGLPLAESLARGRPCLCRTDGRPGRDSPRRRLRQPRRRRARPRSPPRSPALLACPSTLASLSAAARGRRFKSWSDYAGSFWPGSGSLRRDA